MRLTDRDIGKARALVVDGNPTSRSVMVSQLRDLGVESIRQSGRLADARLQLERSTYDIVLCEQHFGDAEMTGQDLLDELRRDALLPWSTVFIMVTSEASYARVVEAAESALDSFLVKPYRAAALAERLMQARERKRALSGIFRALDGGDVDTAVLRCLERFERRESFWPFTARLAAELELQRLQPTAALKIFDALLTVRAWPWARLGAARAHWANGEIARARRSVEALLKEDPSYADAHDVLGSIQLEQGDCDRALVTFRTAAALTPGCLLRLQQHGTAAFHRAPAAEALQLLERSVAVGLGSKLFDEQTLLLLALLRHDAGDAKALLASSTQLAQQLERHPSSLRLQRLCEGVDALRAAASGDASAALEVARRAAAHAGPDGIDEETANLAIALLARLPAASVSDADTAALVAPLALRFCTSKGHTETMASFARPRASVVAAVRDGHAKVSALAEEALAHSVRGRPEVAVRQLLAHGENSGNAKLIQMARLVALRHQDAMSDSDHLHEQATALQTRIGKAATASAGGRKARRAPGALVLRKPLAR
jgi:CheY-like chemotaxis protein